MENKLIHYFQKIEKLTDEEEKILLDTMLIKNYSKNQYLVKEGQFNKDSFFVMEGCVRQFKIIDGNEITTNIFTAEQWIISLENPKSPIYSKYNLVCMENTSVVIGDEQKAQSLFKQFPRLERISRQVMETVFAEQQNLLTSYITDKPEQRYLKLLEKRPDIFQLIPQYDIASYIGIKPESLSRIRRKILEKR